MRRANPTVVLTLVAPTVIMTATAASLGGTNVRNEPSTLNFAGSARFAPQT